MTPQDTFSLADNTAGAPFTNVLNNSGKRWCEYSIAEHVAAIEWGFKGRRKMNTGQPISIPKARMPFILKKARALFVRLKIVHGAFANLLPAVPPTARSALLLPFFLYLCHAYRTIMSVATNRLVAQPRFALYYFSKPFTEYIISK